jgi:hypothetical protein
MLVSKSILTSKRSDFAARRRPGLHQADAVL